MEFLDVPEHGINEAFILPAVEQIRKLTPPTLPATSPRLQSAPAPRQRHVSQPGPFPAALVHLFCLVVLLIAAGASFQFAADGFEAAGIHIRSLASITIPRGLAMRGAGYASSDDDTDKAGTGSEVPLVPPQRDDSDVPPTAARMRAEAAAASRRRAAALAAAAAAALPTPPPAAVRVSAPSAPPRLPLLALGAPPARRERNGVALPESLSAMPCPRVFMYDSLPRGSFVLAPLDIGPETALGIPLDDRSTLYDASHHELVSYFAYRLLHSQHCQLTRDPATADLFFVPVFTGRHDSSDWARACKASQRIDVDSAPKWLPHLNERTAVRHIVLVSNGINQLFYGSACSWLRGEDPLFARIQRFAYTGTLAGRDYHEHNWGGPGPAQLTGDVISVPVLGSVHWSSVSGQPWAEARDRPLLMYFVGGFHGLQKELRRKIYRDCSKLHDCKADNRFSPDALLHKRSAVFCLEPDGDSPWRKSYFDAITNGCIPVFFAPTTVEATSPWHWSPNAFLNSSRLLLSAEGFMRGDVRLESLRDVPKARIAEMQVAIRAYAHRLQYAAEDMPGGDDAFELLLKKAHLRAQGVPWNDPDLVAL